MASEAKPDTDGQSLFRSDQQSSPLGENESSDRQNFSAIDQPPTGVYPTQVGGDFDAFLDKDPGVYDSRNITIGRPEMSMSAKSTISAAPDRAQTNRLYHFCYRVCTHWSFTVFITFLIIGNTVVLALDKYPDDPDVTEITDILNIFFTWAFVGEMIIKLIGLGFREYVLDSFNVFDCIVVILSLVDTIYSATTPSTSQSSALAAFRGVRLLRVFKLARSWPSFRDILAKIIVTIKDVSTFSVLLLMFMFIFTLLGMELFGYKVMFDANDRVVDPESQTDDPGLAPRPNFNEVGMGFVTVFAVAIGDDWNLMMSLAFRAEGVIAIVFYPLVFIFMNLILLNLFLAILL